MLRSYPTVRRTNKDYHFLIRYALGQFQVINCCFQSIFYNDEFYMRFFFYLVLSMCLIRKSSNLLSNITTIFLSIGVPYIQLSLNMEVVFMLVLVITLACWRKIVTQPAADSNASQSSWTQWRHAFFFVSSLTYSHKCN